MKTILNRFVLCLLAAVLCFSTPSRADDDDKKGHLAKGMSKAQVKKLYGDPDGTAHHDDHTETWTYVKDKAKAFLPFVGGPKVIIVTFDGKGKVIKYSSDD